MSTKFDWGNNNRDLEDEEQGEGIQVDPFPDDLNNPSRSGVSGQ